MAELGAIVGESGSGKSTSLRNLDPTATFVINVANKNLPFRSSKKNYIPLTQDPKTKEFTGNLYNTSNVEQISQILKLINKGMPHIQYVIIDDSQYLMSFEAMERASEKG
ncbi:MAG: AAA family ATPase [Candidatus Saccharimonadaceae bacterium]